MARKIFTDLERFERSHIKLSCGCWIWMNRCGTKGSGGHSYGTFHVGSRYDGTRKNDLAHRWAYRWFKGAIPTGKLVCHTCDIPECVNPEHLWIGTVLENSHDMLRKGREPRESARPKNPASGDRHGSKTHPERVHKGEQVKHLAKLTEAAVRDIRSHEYRRGLFQELAAKYNVTDALIGMVFRGHIWKHVQ